MHSSWVYYITGISGYVVASQKLIRNGKERMIKNAARLIRCGVLEWGGLAFLADCPVIIALTILDLILKETQFLAAQNEKLARRTKSRCKDACIVLRLEPKKSEDEKRKCKDKDCKSHDLKFRKGKFRRIRSLDFGRIKVYVEVEVRRIRCRRCGKKFYEKIPFLTSRKARVTRAFEWEMYELRANMSISAVAEWLDIDPDTVKEAEKRILKAKYKRIDLKKTRIIGIDELYVFSRARSDRKYITVVRDMESGAVLNVSRGKGGDALKGFLARLKKQKPKIECVCMDMSNAYGKWVRENLKNALVVYDHFHVIKAMNDRINTIRRKAMARISADVRRCIKELDVTKMAKDELLAAIKREQAREEKAKESLKGNMRLPLMDREDVEKDPKSKKKLDRMLEENKDLGKAYIMKEKLRDIYAYCREEGVAKAMFQSWIKEAKASDVAELEAMAKMVENHLEGVLGFWRYKGASNAKTEGFNNKIRWLIKQAYGYRDYKYLRLKILDLPDLKPRDSDC